MISSNLFTTCGFCEIVKKGGIEFFSREKVDKFKLDFGKKKLDENTKVMKDAKKRKP